MNVCYSGACDGADVTFGEAAEKAGHEVIHYAFSGMHTKCKSGRIVRLSAIELREGHMVLLEANSTLRRKYPCGSPYVDNLLKRNYWQIRDTERVYAVSALSKDMKHVEGGTGWAVEMAIHRKVPEIYVYCQKLHGWYGYIRELNQFVGPIDGPIPKPHGRYTGIGSRELTEEGAEIIRGLYK